MGEATTGMNDQQRPREDAVQQAADQAKAAADSEPRTEGTSDEIRADIVRTRSDLGETLDRIQERLNPQHLKEQAKDAVRGATIGKAEQAVSTARDSAKGAFDTMLDTIKQNPVPSAMAAVGLGWLWMKSRSDGQTNGWQGRDSREWNGTYGNYGYQYGGDYGYGGGREFGSQESGGGGMLERAKSGAGGAMGAVSDTAGNVADRAGETFGQAAEQAKGAAGQVAGVAQGTAGQVAGFAQGAAGQARQGVEGMGSQFRRMLNERPLAVAGIAMAVGAAIGLALPETPQEDRLMGSTRDSLMDQAKAAAEETQHKLQAVAQEAQQAASDAADEQRLTA